MRGASTVIGRAELRHGCAGPELDTPHHNTETSEQIQGHKGPHPQVGRPAVQ